MAGKMTETEKKEKIDKKNRERIAGNLERDLEDLRNGFNPRNPTRFFKVGEEVDFGNITKAVVTEVLDEGLVYKLHIWVRRRTEDDFYSREQVLTEEDAYRWWSDIMKLSSRERKPVFKETDDVRFNFLNKSVGGILLQFHRTGIDLDPEYQRGKVWTLEDKVSLIDSIFKNIDIGKIAIIKRDFNSDKTIPHYEMLDGKQRYIALTEFYEGRFTYKGLHFEELDPSDRSHFENYHIGMAETEELTRLQKLRYFLKLNTGGVAQDPGHMAEVRRKYEEELAGAALESGGPSR